MENVIYWLIGSGVTVGGVMIYKTTYKWAAQLPPMRISAESGFFTRAVALYQNHLLGVLGVLLVFVCLTLAGKIAFFFTGKTTIATIADLSIGAIEGSQSLATWIGNAGESIMTFDGAGVDPAEIKKIREEKSLFNGSGESQQQSYFVPEQPSNGAQTANYATAANYAPATAPLAAANANAPIAPAGSAAVGQPGPVESVVVAEQVAAPAPAAPVAAAAPGNQYAVGNTVTVLPGDSLFKIAQRAYGDGELWRSICNANRGAIGNCDNLKAGMQLSIPAPTYGEQVVSLVTNSESNPVAAAAAAAPQGLASDGRVYYDVAIPTAVPASVAVGTTMDQTAPQQPVVQDNTQIAASNTILKPVV
jgi:hypothetical protein